LLQLRASVLAAVMRQVGRLGSKKTGWPVNLGKPASCMQPQRAKSNGQADRSTSRNKGGY
jgi:hypothetical protein